MTDRIRTILHRDLNVSPDIQLDDDTPLFGSHTDLDSIDALLLISSIEKELKIKVPNQSLGRSTFQSIRALADFLEQAVQSPAGAAAPSPPVDPLSMLPHREPFRFVTRLEKLAPGEAGEGLWVVTGEEPFFAGHFPGNPIVPGVLIAESLAQLSGIVAGSTNGSPKAGRIARLDVRYVTEVRPPAHLRLESRLLSRAGAICEFEVRATAQSQVAAEGRLTMGLG